MPTAGARGAIRLFAPSKTGLRVQSLPHLRAAHTSTPRPLTQCSTMGGKLATSFTFSSHPRPSPATLLQRLRLSVRFFNSSRLRLNGKPTSPNPTPSLNAGAESKPNTLGARMRKLSREYGWSALGVYLALTAIDFPFCYLLVRYLGTEKIGKFPSPAGLKWCPVSSAVALLNAKVCVWK
jgi:N-terminal acetyltransferase 2